MKGRQSHLHAKRLRTKRAVIFWGRCVHFCYPRSLAEGPPTPWATASEIWARHATAPPKILPETIRLTPSPPARRSSILRIESNEPPLCDQCLFAGEAGLRADFA